jgi:hypothetical protein
MPSTARIMPPYMLLFVSDLEEEDSPDCIDGAETVKNARLWATPSCIAIGCLNPDDGDTEVTLGAAHEVDPGRRPVFDNKLATPDRNVIVSTAEHETVLKARVKNISTRIRIWTNHPSEPDRVIVGFD